MADNARLKLTLRNAEGDFLKEKVDVLLWNQTLGGFKKFSFTASKTVALGNLGGPPHGRYRMEIDPPSYLATNRFIALRSNDDLMEFIFPVSPKKVRQVIFPKYAALSGEGRALLERSGNVLSHENKKGAALYDALDDLRRAAMLNILTKSGAAPVGEGQTVLDFLKDAELRVLRQDRFFAVVPKGLREEVMNSVAAGLFTRESGALHHLPGQFVGFGDAGSFKTRDRYGNLQLTFFLKGDECVADIDIDEASGLAHLFEVINNSLPGNDTHPYTVRDILLVYQKLDPGYRFKM